MFYVFQHWSCTFRITSAVDLELYDFIDTVYSNFSGKCCLLFANDLSLS